jgi:hypothetical protein
MKYSAAGGFHQDSRIYRDARRVATAFADAIEFSEIGMDRVQVLDLIRTIANVVSAAAIVLALVQFQLQRKIWLTAHERSRAEKAIEIIRTFSSTFNAQSAATNRLIEKLSPDQLIELDAGRTFSIEEGRKNDVQAALPHTDLLVEGGIIHLTAEQVYQLRFQALEILNNIEIVCQAWRLDVADRETIEK